MSKADLAAKAAIAAQVQKAISENLAAVIKAKIAARGALKWGAWREQPMRENAAACFKSAAVAGFLAVDVRRMTTDHEWLVERHPAFTFRGPSGNPAIAGLANRGARGFAAGGGRDRARERS